MHPHEPSRDLPYPPMDHKRLEALRLALPAPEEMLDRAETKRELLAHAVKVAVRASDDALVVLRAPTPEGGFVFNCEGEEEEEEKEDESTLASGESAARAQVVSSWLLSKEAGMLISDSCCGLVGLSPASAAEAAAIRALVVQGSEALLRTVTSTRHDGACEMAAAALERLCGALWRSRKRHGSREELDGRRRPERDGIEDGKEALDGEELTVELTALPGTWLRLLIDAAAGRGCYCTEHLTHLRRGAGLPAAVRAILRAEQHACRACRTPVALLEPCLASLIALASTTVATATEARAAAASAPAATAAATPASDDVWRPRVHALFILRLLLLDKTLPLGSRGAQNGAWAVEGFAVAFSALSATEWAVSNAGTLCFAAALSRTLREHSRRSTRSGSGGGGGGRGGGGGGAAAAAAGVSAQGGEAQWPREGGGEASGWVPAEAAGVWPPGAIDPRRLFQKQPALRPLLLHTLEAAVGRHLPAAPALSAPAAPAAPAALSAPAVPSAPLELYCALLLLAQLCCPPPAAQTAGCHGLDLREFLPLVHACAASPSYRIRVVAARALVPLVTHTRLREQGIELAAELPASPAALSSAVHGHNRVHGVLLQLHALLATSCQATLEAAHAEGTAGLRAHAHSDAYAHDDAYALAEALPPSGWLLRSRCTLVSRAMAELHRLLELMDPKRRAVQLLRA